MIKIGFDSKRIFCNSSGLGNYSRNLLKILSLEKNNNKLYLYTPKIKIKNYESFIHFNSNVSIKTPKGFISSLLPFLWRSFLMEKQLKKDKIKIFHGLSNELPYITKKSGIKYIVTIHDLIFLRYPKQYNFIDRWIYKLKTKYSCIKADKIIATSQQTKKDIVYFYGINPKKIKVIYQTCHHNFKEKATLNFKKIISKKYNLPNKYLLYVGSINERKNLMSILKAIHKLPTQKLVIVGRGKKYKKKCEKFIDQKNLYNQVFFLEINSTKELSCIYQMAHILIYPSLFEGFGIPIIEALFSKIPVITSKGSCFHEVGGANSIYINPEEEGEIQHAILRIDKNEEYRKSIIKKGYKFVQQFSESSIANNLHELYESI